MWKDFYKDIVLTEEEREEALLEGRIAKFFRDKNADYWREKEVEVKAKKVDSPMKIK